MATEWTEELKAEVVTAYQDRNPTPENTMQLLQDLANEYDRTVNGVRMILTKADAYVKVAKAKPATATASTSVSKAEAIKALTSAIEAAGLEVDKGIIDKLTGKAAVYFTGLVVGVTSTEE